jgi:uncharacterized protein YgiM (DUF1202 family)
MHLRNLVAIFIAAALLAACNINVDAPVPQSDQNAVETMVEQTLQAAVTPFISPAGPATTTTVNPSRTPGSTTPTVTATGSPTVTTTPSGDKVILSITGNSNCRTGPGASYSNVTSFTPGVKLEVIGKNTENNYWLVKIPGSQETCWVWGVYTTATGDLESVPETTPVIPTAIAVVPSQPGGLFYQYECSGYSISVSLSWSDRANNETGYRVYRSDSVVADLPANSTSYNDTVSLAPPQSLQYRVVAYNDHGESSPSAQTFTACP